MSISTTPGGYIPPWIGKPRMRHTGKLVICNQKHILSQSLYTYLFIKIVQAKGEAQRYSYNTDESYLYSLDQFAYEQKVDNNILTRELIYEWLDLYPAKDTTRSRRLAVTNEFARFLVRNGFEAYTISYKYYPKYTREFRAYIFSKQEITRILTAADRYPKSSIFLERHHVISILFHLLVNAGFRISELLNMKVQDVDVKNSILSIQGKNKIPRLVPLSGEMGYRLSEYYHTCLANRLPDAYFLPGTKRARLIYGAVRTYFHQLLWEADIPYNGKNGGPRLHDLRHTFAVHCLNNWVKNNVDLSTALPVLSKYMGHINFKGTQKYLQFIAEMYPDTTAKLEAEFGQLIPKGGNNHENN